MDDKLSINNADGINFSLQVAGLGSRSYAFVIDWHIRLLVVLVWLGLMILIFGEGSFKGLFNHIDDQNMYFIFGLPLFVYLFYHPILEVLMHGQTPGKRLAGVRIVNTQGQTPGVGALLVRNIFRLVDSLPIFYTLGLVLALFTKQSVRIGDMAAGTLLIHTTASQKQTIDIAAELAIESHLSHSDQTLLLDILDRWDALQNETRVRLGKQFLARIGEPMDEEPSDEKPTPISEQELEKKVYNRLAQLGKAK